MPPPPHQAPSFVLSPSLPTPLRSSPPQYSHMQSTYTLGSVPRGVTNLSDYDLCENFTDELPYVEGYEQDTQMSTIYASDAAHYPYQSVMQPPVTSAYWPVHAIDSAPIHLRPQVNSQLISSHPQNTQWNHSSISTSAGSSTASSNYSPMYPSTPTSYPPTQTSLDSRRSKSSEVITSPYVASSHVSPPQTPILVPVTTMPNLDGFREQIKLFKGALELPLSFNAGPFVPQKMYMPHTNSDRRRYVEEIELQPPIYFWMESPDEYGISLIDALHSRVRRLRQRDEPVFEGRGPSISVRIQWPGYRPWSRQIPTKDFRSPPQPITKAKLAKNIAKCVERFLSARAGAPLEDDVDPRWKVGPRNHEIKLEDLYLVSMHHVSMGSWQPHLRLCRPLPE